ncbi:HAUS augmin-like complex subunit 2 isoform X1 [Carcharodon carcharias]|uniref:HAUS augmin-like complex subunit 2 isoform X1 n=1 Tax=Carcharodon carcharias TaxID=13397 RepID=UPI001B7EEBC1|nr:HAUS augmin-like complex subunit 2 isoform X1 [Carcharodon carcharias]XP_041069879.1 HAUS augmin-like complex subunit 2 isoform X1 [Carcharodon carcharias]
MQSANPWEPVVANPAACFLERCVGRGLLTQDILELNKIEFGNTVPFVQRFRLIDEISHTRAELEQKSLELKLLKLQNDTADITHPVCLTEKYSRLQLMNSHLEAILQVTVSLKQRLVQPICHQCLPVEANCHRYVSELLPMMVKFIEKLDSNLQLIRSTPRVSVKVKLMENLVARMASEVLELKEVMDFIMRWREQQKTGLESLGSK